MADFKVEYPAPDCLAPAAIEAKTEAAGKVTIDWVTIFFRGILCNIFVCLAVWIGTAGKTVVDKVVGILLPIAAFVACGFEHCVANMYYFSMAGMWSGKALLYMLVMTLGNAAGGVLFPLVRAWITN